MYMPSISKQLYSLKYQRQSKDRLKIYSDSLTNFLKIFSFSRYYLNDKISIEVISKKKTYRVINIISMNCFVCFHRLKKKQFKCLLILVFEQKFQQRIPFIFYWFNMVEHKHGRRSVDTMTVINQQMANFIHVSFMSKTYRFICKKKDK